MATSFLSTGPRESELLKALMARDNRQTSNPQSGQEAALRTVSGLVDAVTQKKIYDDEKERAKTARTADMAALRAYIGGTPDTFGTPYSAAPTAQDLMGDPMGMSLGGEPLPLQELTSQQAMQQQMVEGVGRGFDVVDLKDLDDPLVRIPDLEQGPRDWLPVNEMGPDPSGIDNSNIIMNAPVYENNQNLNNPFNDFGVAEAVIPDSMVEPMQLGGGLIEGIDPYSQEALVGAANTEDISPDMLAFLSQQGINAETLRQTKAAEQQKYLLQKQLTTPVWTNIKNAAGDVIGKEDQFGNVVEDITYKNKQDIASGQYFTPAQQALDTAFAKTYNEFVVEGGVADARKGVEQLVLVKDALLNSINNEDAPNLSGPLIGSYPDAMRAAINPEAQNTLELLQEVVQRNLRTILGGQFAQQEGDRLIARAYNASLDEKQNYDRVVRLITAVNSAVDSKLSASNYFEENGTLVGYKGTTFASSGDAEADASRTADGILRAAGLTEDLTDDDLISYYTKGF